jgi:hypothetical protein
VGDLRFFDFYPDFIFFVSRTGKKLVINNLYFLHWEVGDFFIIQ